MKDNIPRGKNSQFYCKNKQMVYEIECLRGFYFLHMRIFIGCYSLLFEGHEKKINI